ncbi:hypothetical protein Pmani_030132 [Petrolisthes manimaculis]|uniref:Uncharacterized protein n=1 Tax=Petrolisthes manimaculis TaxID=1843537 RepID=A0AAE1NW46_9EUCA|nr:hypothetical protein Pmani_030132 [Petrolisthes manimaculis]
MGGKQKKKEAAAERQQSGGRERKGKGKKQHKGEDNDDDHHHGGKQVPKGAGKTGEVGEAKVRQRAGKMVPQTFTSTVSLTDQQHDYELTNIDDREYLIKPKKNKNVHNRKYCIVSTWLENITT